jgi:MFS family permease
MLLVVRFVNGLGVEMLLVVTPMYLSELSLPQTRGFLVSQHGAFLAIGYNIAAWTGFGCYFTKNRALAWRLPLAMQVIFTIILLAGSFGMPRSPRWLITHDRGDEALAVTSRLHRSPSDPDNFFTTAEYNQMVAQIEFEKVQRDGRMGFIVAGNFSSHGHHIDGVQPLDLVSCLESSALVSWSSTTTK